MRTAIDSLLVPVTRLIGQNSAVEPHDDYSVVPIDDRAAWEAQLERHPLRNVYSSWGWGEYKERLGWQIERLVVRDRNGTCLGMAQVQRRRKFGLPHAYIHGGPLVFASDDTVAERTLATLLARIDPGRFGFVVINYERHETPTTLLATLACGLRPALNRAQHTIVLDTSIGLPAIRTGLRRLWSRQLVKALANKELSTHFAETREERAEAFDAFAAMYDELARRKGFDMAVVPDLFRETAVTDPRFIMLTVRDGSGIIAVRIAHCGADRLVDLINASGAAAMASNANTLAVWRLIEHTISSGLRYYDFCGIDPVANPGVFRFKRGINGDTVQSGPLWLYARNTIVGSAMQVLLTLR